MCKSRAGSGWEEGEAEEEGLFRDVGAGNHPQANGFLRRESKSEG